VTDVVADAENRLLSFKQLVEACDPVMGEEVAISVREVSYTFGMLDLLVRQRIETWTWSVRIVRIHIIIWCLRTWTWTTKVIWSRGDEFVIASGQVKALLRGIEIAPLVELRKGGNRASICNKAGDGE
jgi:hypothetical protein